MIEKLGQLFKKIYGRLNDLLVKTHFSHHINSKCETLNIFLLRSRNLHLASLWN